MNKYFFSRKNIERRDERFWLTIEINEEVRPGVVRRKAMIEVWYVKREDAEEAKEKWTDARLRKLAAFF